MPVPSKPNARRRPMVVSFDGLLLKCLRTAHGLIMLPPAYQKAMRKRSVWIEPLFGEAKQWHQLVQFRLRRLHKVNIQALLIAAGQNIKRLLKQRPSTNPCPPIQPLELLLPLPSAFHFSTKVLVSS